MESFKFLIPEESNGVIVKNISMLRELEEKLRKLFLEYEYKETLMPTFEYMDLYKNIYNNATHENVYSFINDKGENIALRWDFTIPLARFFVSQNNEKIARYSYFGTVYRKPKKFVGKMSEYYQAGIELINVSGIKGEKEILDILIKSLSYLNLKNVKIELGSSLFFNRILQMANNQKELIEILAKKNISEMNNFIEKNNFDKKFKNLLIKLPRLCGTESILDTVIRNIDDEILLNALYELKKLNDIINTNNTDYEVIFDLSMVPTMEYYTGFMFKVYSEFAPNPIISRRKI